MVKNQHYIPEFYLKRFGKNEKIDAYDIKNKKFIPNTNVSNFACRRFFYDTEYDNLKNTLSIYKQVVFISEEKFENKFKELQFIEKFLSRLEGEMSIYFENFEKDNSLIDDENFLITLFIFMDILSIRTVSYRKEQENIAEQKLNWLKSLDKEIVKNYSSDIDPKEVAKRNQLNSIISLSRISNKALNFFEKYDIFVGINNTEIDFIISDNVLKSFYLGFNDICFPINPRLAIIMQVRGVDKKYRICNAKPDKDKKIFLKEIDVIKYNIIQEHSNSNFLFGNELTLKKYLKFVKIIMSILNNKDFN